MASSRCNEIGGAVQSIPGRGRCARQCRFPLKAPAWVIEVSLDQRTRNAGRWPKHVSDAAHPDRMRPIPQAAAKNSYSQKTRMPEKCIHGTAPIPRMDRAVLRPASAEPAGPSESICCRPGDCHFSTRRGPASGRGREAPRSSLARGGRAVPSTQWRPPMISSESRVAPRPSPFLDLIEREHHQHDLPECGWCYQRVDMSGGIYDDGEWMCAGCIDRHAT